MKTETLTATPQGLARAAHILRAQGLVAFPTETVYGLGGDARSDLAVARIFDAKGRPSFNPLIVHVPDLAAASTFANFDARAEAIAAAFWPGPLTLVLPLRDDAGLSPLVTAESGHRRHPHPRASGGASLAARLRWAACCALGQPLGPGFAHTGRACDRRAVGPD